MKTSRTTSELLTPIIRPSDKVGFVAARFPKTQDVFDWFDIDPEYDGGVSLDDICDELGIDVDDLVDQLIDVTEAPDDDD